MINWGYPNLPKWRCRWYRTSTRLLKLRSGIHVYLCLLSYPDIVHTSVHLHIRALSNCWSSCWWSGSGSNLRIYVQTYVYIRTTTPNEHTLTLVRVPTQKSGLICSTRDTRRIWSNQLQIHTYMHACMCKIRTRVPGVLENNTDISVFDYMDVNTMPQQPYRPSSEPSLALAQKYSRARPWNSEATINQWHNARIHMHTFWEVETHHVSPVL